MLTLATYKLFLEPNESIVVTSQDTQPTFLPTNNTGSNLYNSVDVTDFTMAAENTIHAVVHVKNTAIVSTQPTFEDLFFGRPASPV